MTAVQSSARPLASNVLSTDVTEERLAECLAPCFTYALKIQTSTALGAPDELRRDIKEVLSQCESDAQHVGFNTETIAEAKFAVVALIDETILSSSWSGTSQWMKTPLQLEFYDQFDAGEVFFERLHELAERPTENAQILEVYYLCMVLGFKGKYQLQDQEQLRELVESTAQLLSETPETRTDELAPHGQPRDPTATEVRRTIPSWVIAAAAILLGVLLYGGMYLYVTTSAHETARVISQMSAG
ncbi:type IVB secretion system protein IcmH/DotU [Salinibacter sp. 10B]|uniref:type IVB secretion system protein IcmH/DotU n=1 Tax=Salinibacter sp. 10B TaxID=1923971 RepID=UPI0011B01427|nr:type IVB secretion system protein IcmH/DotU [Salinibacter sp. 10B]